MISIKRGAAPGEPHLPYGSDRGLARRSRWAGAALAVLLVAMGVFGVWSAYATSDATQRAVKASVLSNAYADANRAVADEQSLERQYRLTPAPSMRVAFAAAGDELTTALEQVQSTGGATDRREVTAIMVNHGRYVQAVNEWFAAIDAEDPEQQLQLFAYEVDPAFTQIQDLVSQNAGTHLQVAVTQFNRLLRLEKITRRVTPMVVLAGLLTALALSAVTRGYRRLLNHERAQAVHDSLHDELTGLPNRVLFADRVEQALRGAARSRTEVGLLLIDLDRFKEINDTFGHHYGDELLRLLGTRLSEALRSVDTVARLGGDEFAVLLPEVNAVEDAALVADKLTAALHLPFRVEGIDLDVDASVGVVLSGRHGQDVATLLQRADIAMYVAKSQGLGVVVYDQAVDSHSPAKHALLGDLRRGLERGELFLNYQPKVSISTGDIVGVEALLRWRHPTQGLIPPDQFIPLAEQTGLIGPLSRHVLDTALAQARRWADAGRPTPVAVNLSARNLLDERLPGIVAQLLTLHRVGAELLVLEVTESAIITEPARALRLLESLSELGIRISLDDFGTGYTSLGQLKNLPVNELKIDRSFVNTMTRDDSNALIVRSVIEIGHSLGLTIVAEGVEDDETLAALAGASCDVAQGYLLCRPQTAEILDAWWTTRTATPTPAAT